ncbi:MAG: hypothetical protein ABR924_00450 [Terracidiphilus sp.]|jgi:hypothetical protein
MTRSVLDKTQFLNVDLDIVSKSDLKPLIDAMGGQIYVLFLGRVKRHYEAHLEAAGSGLPAASHHSSPESLILRLCKVIRRLPPDARGLWDSARTRSFDIGIEARGPYRYYWFPLRPKTIKAALEVNAQIAVTVYGPLKRARGSSKNRRDAASK